MLDRFMGLAKEKQDRIINAALKEFAQKGFTDASTNEIVKEAGISKGLLFHYFTNKQNLFLYVYDYALGILQKEMLDKMDMIQGDIFDRFMQVSLLKVNLVGQYPDLFAFLVTALLKENQTFHGDLYSKSRELTTSMIAKLFEGIDTTKFKEGIDIAKASNIIRWTLDGFGNQLTQRVKSWPLSAQETAEIIAETEEYFQLLKTGLYKD